MQGDGVSPTIPAPPDPCDRSRLDLETFSEFLAAIKELNCGRANRVQTMRRARQLFGGAGSSNHDLFELFERLLSRHGAAPP